MSAITFGAPAFALPRMPKHVDVGTLPLRWLVARADELDGPAVFGRILRQVDPVGARALGRNASNEACFCALVEWMTGQGFEFASGCTAQDLLESAGERADWDGEEYGIEQWPDAALIRIQRDGIDFEVYGIDRESLLDPDYGRPVLGTAAVVVATELSEYEFVVDEALKDARALLAGTVPADVIDRPNIDWIKIKPGKGRIFKPDWQSAIMFARWVISDTGFDALNMSMDDVHESGRDLPRWNTGEVRGYVKYFQQVNPVWQGIKRFRGWLHKSANARVPLFLRLLKGDAQALEEVTQCRA